MSPTEQLIDLGIFRGLPLEERTDLAAKGQIRPFAAGETIALRGQDVDALFAVLQGRVKLSRSSLEGKEQTLYVFGPGEPFCLCGVFGTGRFLADAVALSHCRVFILSRQEFDRAAHDHPALLRNMVEVLSGRLRQAMELVESLALREIPQRVAAYLLTLPADTPQGCNDPAQQGQPEPGYPVELGMTHRELAKIVGATPETLSRALRRLDEEGLVTVSGGRIRLLDPEALRQRAEMLS